MENEKNDPKLVGKSVISDDDKQKFFKTVFSTCNIEDKKCRGWELQSEEFRHNKKNNYLNIRTLGLKFLIKK